MMLASKDISRHRVSVCPSVTSRCSTETPKCWITQTMPHDSPGTGKKMTTQALCGQREVNHYPIHRTAVPVLSIFLISAFSPSKLQFLLGNSLSNRFAPYFLFFCKDMIKYLSSVLIPITDV